MKKRDKIYWIILLTLLIIYFLAESVSPRPVDWSPDFSSGQSKPYGCSVLRKLLPSLFPGNTVRDISENTYSFLSKEYSRTSMIYITQDLSMGSEAEMALYNHINKGASVFIAAENISDSMKKMAGISIERFINITDVKNQFNSKPFTQGFWLGFYQQPSVKYEFNYEKRGMTYIEDVDSSFVTPVGYAFPENKNKDSVIVFSASKIGKGFLFIHTLPLLFTNYYIHSKDGIRYSEICFSQLPIRNVFWDECYKPGRNQSESSLSFILQVPALRKAWMLLLILTFLYILFVGKRKQRPIPIVSPPQNISLDFVKTMGMLYFEKKNNEDIISKRIKYLNEFLKKAYSVSFDIADIESLNAIEKATGCGPDQMKGLRSMWLQLSSGKKPDDKETIRYSKIIDEFYKQIQYGK